MDVQPQLAAARRVGQDAQAFGGMWAMAHGPALAATAATAAPAEKATRCS